jgi:phospholipid/cholesterol/gamma-HCH transport system substrate-binding protein
MSGAPLAPAQRINLGALIGLGVVALLWATSALVDIDAVDRPYYVTVQFEDSGLVGPHSEVAHLGVRVGKVSRVSLSEDMGLAEVRLRLDEGTEIRDDVRVSVSRKSAIGEPFLDLLPPGGDRQRSGAMLSDGDVIGPERTDLPVRFEDVLEGVDGFIAPIDPEAADRLIHELAVGLDGRVTDLRSINEGFAELVDGLADRRDRLGRLTDNSATVLRTFADHRDSLGSSLEHLRLLTGTVADARDSLDRALVEGEAFTGLAAGLVSAELPRLDCLLDGLAGTTGGFASDEGLADLAFAFDVLPAAFAVIEPAHDILADGGRWARGGLVFTDAEGILVYEEPRGLPEGRPVPACGSPLTADADAGDRPAADDGGGGPAPGDGTVDGAERPTDAELASSEPPAPAQQADRLPMLLAVFGGVIAAAALFLGLRKLRARGS